MNADATSQPAHAIAIIGMAGRFPGASDPSELWNLVLEGKEVVRAFTKDELREAGVPEDVMSSSSYRPYAATLDGIEDFDAEFFGITPAEARLTDPQHRLFLECVLSALEDAGTSPSSCNRNVGVFGSSSLSSYLVQHVLADPVYSGSAFDYSVLLGNDKDFLTTRVSYRLGLQGPSSTIQSACSSSLAAVDAAVSALLLGRCEVAVAGGVSITTPQTVGYTHRDGGTFSADGHCRPFDANASGMVRGSGAAVVVLKRLDQAVQDRDRVYAVISGIAVNNDGARKAGFTAPGYAGQVEAARQALEAAGVSGDDIGYVEAHGTGTFLGDPIEIAALSEAYGEPEHLGGSTCALGSIKANIGHLDAAAGVTGLIKAALVLHHQRIPPQINFTATNPQLYLDDTRFHVPVTAVRPERALRAAGVTALGIGGTNVHCVLTAAPPVPPRPAQAPEGAYVLKITARSHAAIRATAADLADWLTASPDARLDDVAYTLRVGREPRAVSGSVIVRSIDDAVAALRALADGVGEFPTDADLGCDIDKQRTSEVTARKVSLPLTRFQRTRHWIDHPRRVMGDLAIDDSVREGSTEKETDEAGPAAGDTLTAVTKLLRDRLGSREFGPDDDFFAHGGDSLTAVAVVAALRDVLPRPLTLNDFTAFRTPRRVVEANADRPKKNGPSDRDGLFLIKEGNDDQAVFLIHPSGGTVMFAYALAAHSSYGGAIWAIGYPSDAVQPPRSITELAERYAALVRCVRPYGPYRLGGYSLGGTVALEMARILESQEQEVERIVLLDTLPPEKRRQQVDESSFLSAFPDLLAATLGVPLPPPRLEGPPSADEAIELLAQPDWTEHTRAALRAVYKSWLHTLQALQTHTPSSWSGPVHIIAAQDPLPFEHATMPPTPLEPDDWRPVLTGHLNVARVPGDHFSIFGQAMVPAVARAFDDALSEPIPARTMRAGTYSAAEPEGWMFAGQGTQYPGMGAELLSAHAELVELADSVLGYSITSVCAGDATRPLTDTLYAQPALYVVHALAAKVALEEYGPPVVALGHSLGEYNALEVAGVIGFEDGLRLVLARAQAMSRVIGGGMIAVSGISPGEMRNHLNSLEIDQAYVAAVNTSQEISVAGSRADLNKLAASLPKLGATAVRWLAVAGPYHTPLMAPAAEEFASALSSVEWRTPALPVYANATGMLHEPARISSALLAHLTEPVLWYPSVEAVLTSGVLRGGSLREIGVSRVLTPLVTRIRATIDYPGR
ncbi:beta-ketoacyl synthase N-terminal-like domain-containing protein [Streptomyces sp. NPDC087908]|uniref:beta-ketoacyl synthase N-terminal-like domain-containing protein n=1 Tax=Streptomyces sp. NPDC087908 TaxID=3365820 RepID=UPI003815922B